MATPKFNVEINKSLDSQYLLEFFNLKNPLILKFYPFLKSKEDIDKLIKFMYKNKIGEIEKTQQYIQSKLVLLENIAKSLADLVETDWKGIDKINIIPAICPVCPRIIESNTFLVTYFYNKESILRICAHEMSHFIYFKKLKSLFLSENIDTEFPGNDWLLSEIVTPLLINSSPLQRLITQKDEFYSPTDVEGINKLQKQIKVEFDNRKNFDDFIIKSRKIIAKKD